MVEYPEGGMPGLLLKQRGRKPMGIDTFKVQLVPLRAAPKTKISVPEDVATLVKEMEDYDREYAKIIHLDTKNQVMGVETISIGSLSASIVHPRETVKGAILNNSANVIFVHNHPSGICGPSNEDVEISGKLKEAFETVGIVLLDSIIVGKGCYHSLRETGFISGRPEHAMMSGSVREPARETKDKVEFISALTEYIKSGSDLERRNRAGEKIQASRYFKPWFEEFFYEHDRESAKRNLMKFFVANEQGLGVVNHTYYGVLSEYLGAISKPVLMVREAAGPCERIKEIKAAQQKLSKELADAYRAKDNTRVKKLVETGNLLRAEWDSLVGKCQEIQWKQMKGEKERSQHTVSENIHTPNNIEAFLNRLTVDTAVPIPESQVTGAAIPEGGFLLAYHMTDDPRGVLQKLKSNIPLCQMNPDGDIGCGLYVSGVPQYWRGRSTGKWEFAKQLNRAQRQSLANVILSDPRYRKGGGYLADFEVGYLNRDLKQFVETGDVNLLAGTGNQPYNVRITAEIARKAGVPEPKEPGLIKVKLQGKFINAAGLYSNAEIVNRAQAWAVINRPRLLQYDKRASTQNIVNAWLCSMGYCGAFTKSGMSTNPEMVIWGRKAIIDVRT